MRKSGARAAEPARRGLPMPSVLTRCVTRASARVWSLLMGSRLRGAWQHWRWERRWNDPRERPKWLEIGVPPVVVAAVESGWFPRGARALEIGCGSGQVAAWLADQGYRTVAVDFSESALRHARHRFAESPGRLEFHLVDVCRALPPGDAYQVLIDYRCYHQIPRGDRRAYWRTIVRVSAPGARMLVIASAFRGLRAAGDPVEVRRVTGVIEDGLDGAFEIERVTDDEFETYSGADPDVRRLGLAFWMVRRDTLPPPR
jgi:SAM-dependent methyltransferase